MSTVFLVVLARLSGWNVAGRATFTRGLEVGKVAWSGLACSFSNHAHFVLITPPAPLDCSISVLGKPRNNNAKKVRLKTYSELIKI